MCGKVPYMGRILVLDDSQEVCAKVSAGLARAGHQVETCLTPAEAHVLMTETAFGLIIVEPALEGADGFEFMTQLIENPLNARAPVIVITHQTATEFLVKSMTMGVECVLAKPFPLRILRDKVELLLAPHRLRKGAFDPSILRVFLEATATVFENEGGVSLVAGKPFLKNGNRGFNEFSAVVALKGDFLEGLCVLNIDRDTLAAVWRQSQRNPAEEASLPPQAIESVFTNLTASIFELARTRLLKEKKAQFDILPPTFFGGLHHTLDYGGGGRTVLAVPLSWDSRHTAYLEFSLQLSTNLLDEPKQTSPLQTA